MQLSPRVIEKVRLGENDSLFLLSCSNRHGNKGIRNYLDAFSGTIILGLGTGILNVLIPSSINEYYPYKRGLVMGIYSASLTVASALTAAFIVPLSSSLGGWKNAFLFPAIFPLSSDYLASIF